MREMESHDEQTHYVKRVVLPSGKTIEVVYFRETGQPLASTEASTELIPNKNLFADGFRDGGFEVSSQRQTEMSA